MKNVILLGDVFDKIKEIPDESVHCVVTSPPYWGLRDYGTAEWEGGDSNCSHRRDSKKSDKTITGHKNFDKMNGVGDSIYKSVCKKCGAIRLDKQIGLEGNISDYVSKMVLVFSEIKRVLRKDGTVWLNLGDSYNGSGGSGSKEYAQEKHTQFGKPDRNPLRYVSPKNDFSLKPKDLCGVPWRVAFALQEDGWWLRQDIIWYKKNPMPESVTDRCTKAHEYIFLLSKSAHYYYDIDSIKIPVKQDWGIRDRTNGKYHSEGTGLLPHTGLQKSYKKANKRSVWTVAIQSYKGAHFATFPEKLIEPCILAGCPKDGIVLDPFFGSGTVGVVALRLDRNFIGIELKPEYVEMANKRLCSFDLLML